MPIFERLGYHSNRRASRSAQSTSAPKSDGTRTPSSDVEEERIDKQEEQVVVDLGDKFTIETLKVGEGQ